MVSITISIVHTAVITYNVDKCYNIESILHNQTTYIQTRVCDCSYRKHQCMHVSVLLENVSVFLVMLFFLQLSVREHCSNVPSCELWCACNCYKVVFCFTRPCPLMANNNVYDYSARNCTSGEVMNGFSNN